jgi:hypothetical protein
LEGDFNHFNFSTLHFSALIFVGSLVHVSPEALPAIIVSTCQALNSGGILLITVKEGTGTSRAADGRIFTLWSKENVEKVFTATSLHIVDFSRQISKIRPDDIWLGYVLRHHVAA